MTKIELYKNEKGKYIGFKIEGHSGYGPIGTDIVCAGISTIAYTTMLHLLMLKRKLQVKIDDGYMYLFVCNEIVDQLPFKIFKTVCKQIEKEYSKYVKFSEVEKNDKN